MTPLMRARHQGLLEVHGAVALFGFAGLFGKILDMGPFSIVFGRCLFGALTLAIMLPLFGQGPALRLRGKTAGLFSLGVLLAAHWFSFFHAIRISSVAVGLLTYSTFPLFVAFMEPWFFKEPRRPSEAVNALVVFAGVGFIVPSYDLGNAVTQGVLWGLFSGFTFALLMLLNRRYVRDYSPVVIAYYQNAAAAVILTPSLFFQTAFFSPRNILYVALLGVFCTAFAHALFIRGLRHMNTRGASVVACLEPVYGILLANFILGEVPGWRTLAGGAAILGAALFASLKTHPPQRPLRKDHPLT
jgi:drug/metabolite transporter (DMT)-like permease